MTLVICFLIGILAALVGSMMGLGGGIVLVPTLLLLHYHTESFTWATSEVIVGISLFVMIFTALSATISYGKKGQIDYRTGLLFAVGSIPGGMIGSWLSQFIAGKLFAILFGCLMLFLTLLMIFLPSENARSNWLSRRLQQRLGRGNIRVITLAGQTYTYKVPPLFTILLAIGIGVMSGLFGIGGGIFLVPMMMMLFHIPAHIATATSMFTILFISLASTSTHVWLGHLVWGYALVFVPGAWIGAKLGAQINQRLSTNALTWIFRLLIVIMGFRLIFSV